MKLAIIGTRGIPNRYGGFEQASEFLSAGLAARGYEVYVYCSHNHPYREKSWKGVQLVHCYDPEKNLHTAGQFIYDLNCIRDAGRRHFDVILFMGYTSSSIWAPLFPKNTLIISNMDGLEWKRDKYSFPVKRFLRLAERMAVKHSHFHIADSEGIKQHLDKTYQTCCEYIPYGAARKKTINEEVLKEWTLEKNKFFMLMARMEPENNIETILDGFTASKKQNKMLVIGNTANRYGKRIREKYKNEAEIIFAGSLFEQDALHALRQACRLYFHGHSVGGTNPSLLEAMADGALIAAHDNVFNRSIIGEDGFYFRTGRDVTGIMDSADKQNHLEFTVNNLEKVDRLYNWERVTEQYDNFIRKAYSAFKGRMRKVVEKESVDRVVLSVKKEHKTGV